MRFTFLEVRTFFVLSDALLYCLQNVCSGGMALSLVLFFLELFWHKFHKHFYNFYKKMTSGEMLEENKESSIPPQPVLMDFYYMP